MGKAEPAVFGERPRVAVPCGCILGEAPIWDPRTGTLHWVDIKGQALWRWRPGQDEPTTTTLDEPVGFVRLTDDPGLLLLGLKGGLSAFTIADNRSRRLLAPEPDRPGNRLNDADVGPDGALYFGSMDDAEREPTGAFYRWDGQRLDTFGTRAVVTNGPCIDPERCVLYTADTQAGRVLRHGLRPDGAVGPGEAFVTFEAGQGHPDGLTIDAESHLWICHFGGRRITRFDPSGAAVLTVPMPTGKVTKVAFGGPALATLYVTTAAIGLDRETDPLAGHLFAVEAGIRGRPPALVPAAVLRPAGHA